MLKVLDEEWSWQMMTLEQFVNEGNVDRSWDDLFRNRLKDHVKKVSDFLKTECKDKVVYPPIERVFRAFCVPIERVRVVIVGQDCYHDGNAVGLCFSIPKKRAINPSLRNIYKELELEGYHPEKDGDLSFWAKQGCLMLNTALTVIQSSPGSHLAIWKKSSEVILEYISNNTRGVAWILFGKEASQCLKYTGVNGHRAFVTSHPSPLAANRPFQNYPPFLGSGIFRSVDKFLEDKKISWDGINGS
jgi:uracil-DNA glycosylase